ncbi:MAG: hypothetical protein N2517_08015, partial [Ignavibacteria bacterium]|nr:hypothetical protein [Ignavibacteria bacterium]
RGEKETQFPSYRGDKGLFKNYIFESRNEKHPCFWDDGKYVVATSVRTGWEGCATGLSKRKIILS